MGTCETPITHCTGLAGCGGRLCRNMRHALSKMTFISRTLNEFGEPCGEEKTYTLCGFITKLRAPSDPSFAVPGIMGSASNVRLTVVASGVALKVGDVVRTEDRCYRVESQLSELPVRFSLVETGESL